MSTPKRFLEDDDTPPMAAVLLRFLWVPVEASSGKQRALARLLRASARRILYTLRARATL